MNTFAISGLLVGISSLAMGIFVLYKNPFHRLNRIWCIFTFSVALWGFGGMWIGIAENEREALLAWRISYAFGVVWIPILFYHFVTIFCQLEQRHVVLANYITGIALFPFILSSSQFFGGVRKVWDSFYYSMPGSALFDLFFAWWVWLVIYAHYQVFKLYRHASGIKRNQFKYFFIAVALGYGFGALDYLPIYNIDLYPYGNFGIVAYPIIMTYAIIRYRLMDITMVMSKGLTYALLLSGILFPAYIAVLISQRATPYSLPSLFSGTIVFALGLWIILQKPRSVTHQTLGLLSMACALWQFSFFMIYSTTNTHAALFWEQVMYIGLVYTPAFFTHFVRSFLKFSDSTLRTAIPYLISTVFLMLLSTSYFQNGQHVYFWGHYPKAGTFFPLFVVYFLGYAVFSLKLLYQGFKTQEVIDLNEGSRIKYVFWAFLIGYTSSIDFIQNFGVEFYPFGFIFITLWILMVSFAIAKYQVLNIRISIPKNVFFWHARDFTIILIFYFTIVAIIWSFTGTQHFALTAILLASFSIFSELLLPLQKNIERAIGQTIFKQRNDALKTLTTFSQDLVAILDLNDLNTRFLHTLSGALGVSNLSLFVFEKEKDIFSLATSQGSIPDSIQDQTFSPQHVLPSHFQTHRSILIREELENIQHFQDQQEIHETLKHMEVDLCLPLINQDRLVGFCNLGPRTSLEMYSEEELSLLTALAQNAALALDHALLYEDWKRSQLLMRRTDRLRSLETIAGGFAHEIRNPLTSIKTFIQLAPERRNDAEFITDFSRVVNEDVNRIERLIEEVLDYARYMKPRLTEEDLNEIVSSCLYFVQVKAGSLGITLEQDLSPHLPYVMVDRQQFKQVLLNLLLNALEAITTTPGKIKISTHLLHKDTKEEWVQIKVSDTGPGISPANLEHIFDPFYTTKHESGEHEGTGLGLAIVHQIVQEHHGIIHVESRINTGTTFLVDIPASPCHATPQTVIGGT